MKSLFCTLLIILFAAPQVFAQVGGRGGGREKEIMATQLLLDLIPYLESPSGMKRFPEILEYNRITKVRLPNGQPENFFPC